MKTPMSYMDSVHRDGRIWNLSVMVLLFAFPVSVACIFGVLPDWGALAMGLIATAPMYWVVGVIETVTYVPMLGAGGSYLSFVSGNISILKLPCALNGLEQNGVSASSEEGEVISTIAIATCSIVTTLVIVVGVCVLSLISPILDSPVLKPAFDNILPALFGGLGVVYISKNWKLAIAPLVFMIVLFLLVPSLAGSVGVLVPVGVLIALGAGRVMYKKGWV